MDSRISISVGLALIAYNHFTTVTAVKNLNHVYHKTQIFGMC